MMNPIKTRISIFAAALLSGLSILAASGTAQASPAFPPYLQTALENQVKVATGMTVKLCVPQCTACHLTNLGGFGTLNVFGANLKSVGGLTAVDTSKVGTAVAQYFAMDPNGDSDGDRMSDILEIEAGDSPAIAGPRGQSKFCPDIKYGCAGGRIASAPARDDKPAFFAAALVVVGLSAAMRRRAGRAPRTR